jgi:hypothetical protein
MLGGGLVTASDVFPTLASSKVHNGAGQRETVKKTKQRQKRRVQNDRMLL